MRDDEHAFARVCVSDPQDRCENSREVRLAALSVMVVRTGEALCDLGAREAGPGPDVHLAQSGICNHRDRVRRREDLGGFEGTTEVARVDSVEGRRRQLLCELARLSAPCLVERGVSVALESSLKIPVGLAVPRKQDRRGHVDYGSRMPVLEVTALPQAPRVDLESVAAALTRAVAAELGEDQSGTWVVWRTVDPGGYVEGSTAAAVQPTSTHPPLVRVIAYQGRTPETISRVLARVAETIVAELGLTEGNAFVTWDEARAGRVYTGGAVLGA